MSDPVPPLLTRRRTVLAAAVAAALAVAIIGYGWSGWSKPASRPPVIAAVHLTAVDTPTFEGFREGLARLGHVDGQNVDYDYAGAAESVERLESLLAAIMDRKPDLIFVSSTPAALAVQRATAEHPVPVVFAPVNDPIGAGIAQSLDSPGGNLTGIRLPQSDGLRWRWLTRLAPGVRRVLFPYNPDDGSAVRSLQQARQASAALGLALVERPAPDAATLQRGLHLWLRNVDAVFLPRDSLIEAHIADFVRAANARRLPLAAPSLTQVEAGALFSFGFVHREIGQQAARIADQILRGVAPRDLPIETARSYLAINLRTARAIGMQPSDEALRQAQVVIR